MRLRFASTRAHLLSSTRMRREGEPAEEGGTSTNQGGVERFVPNVADTQAEQEARNVAGNPPIEGEKPAGERPEGLPEGVESWDAFAKMTAPEKAKALGLKPEDLGTVTTTEQDGTKPALEGVDLIVAQSLEGVAPELAEKVSPFVKAFAETGTLTDEQVAEAAKASGFSEAMVRQYMVGGATLTAQATEAAVAPFYEMAGGETQYAEFQAWASEALGPDDHAAINKVAVDGEGKPADIQKYVDQWKQGGGGKPPVDLTKNNSTDPGTPVSEGYATFSEQTKAQSDPRYKSDEGYRNEVIAKIAKSKY